MALIGPGRIAIAALRDAILAALAAGFTARAQTLALCSHFDPGTLADDSGNLIIPTPALLLEIGPWTRVASPYRPMSGERCYAGDLIEWRAYHLVSTRPSDRNGDTLPERADPDLHTAEMAAITRAILDAEGGNRWGHAGVVDRPDWEGTGSEPVDMKLPAISARVLRWQQAALLAESYI